MGRIYNRKGDKAVSARITIPITQATADLLDQRATSAGIAKTEYARKLLLVGLMEAGR